jgi:formylglycine-generating enzyme required for sulfatase activity
MNKKSPIKIIRGGSWINSGRNVRSASRSGLEPAGRNVIYGFRLVFKKKN